MIELFIRKLSFGESFEKFGGLIPFRQIIGQFAGHVTWPGVASKARLVHHLRLTSVWGGQCRFELIGYIFSAHRRAQLPSNNIARVIVEDGR